MSASVIAACLFFGIIGTLIFKEGRKRTSTEMYFIGIGLMVYPYFVEGDILVWVVGIGLTAWGLSFMRN